MKIREHYIDVAKGIAMILVIIGHITILPTWLYAWINSFHMPLFFFLSGMVYNPNKYDKFRDFFKAKFKGLIVPYFFLCLIIWVVARIFCNPDGFFKILTLQQFIGIFVSFRRSNFYASLWFFLALFFSEILMYPIVKIIDKKIIKEKIKGWLLAFIAIALSIIGFVVLHYIKNGFFLSLDLIPLTACFVMFGYITKLNKEGFKKVVKLPASLIYIVISVAFTYLNFKLYGASSLYNSVVGNYIYYMLAAFAGTLFVITICKKINKNRVLEYIGKNTIIYYAFQKPVILPTITAVVNTLGNNISILNNLAVKIIIITVLAVMILGIISQMIANTYPFILGRFKRQEKTI